MAKIVVMTGVVNGVNQTFSVPDIYVAGVHVITNGSVYDATDPIYGWTESPPSSVIMTVAPTTGAVLQAIYDVSGVVDGTWSYSGDPSSSDLDYIRFRIGDTNIARQLLQDTEINAVVVSESNVLLAAAICCESIAAKFSFDVDMRNMSLSLSAGQRSQAYLNLAKKLRIESAMNANQRAPILVGGRLKDDRESEAQDTTIIQPSFRIGQDDNVMVGVGNEDPYSPWRR